MWVGAGGERERERERDLVRNAIRHNKETERKTSCSKNGFGMNKM